MVIFFSFKTVSHYVSQAGPQLVILLPQPLGAEMTEVYSHAQIYYFFEELLYCFFFLPWLYHLPLHMFKILEQGSVMDNQVTGDITMSPVDNCLLIVDS